MAEKRRRHFLEPSPVKIARETGRLIDAETMLDFA
jgi:hypothetical protein